MNQVLDGRVVGIKWNGIGKIPTRNYLCGYCGREVGPENGMTGDLTFVPSESNPIKSQKHSAFIYSCNNCGSPTFFSEIHGQIPGPKIGRNIESIPDCLVERLYSEARECFAGSCFTASVLCCRKLLMHIAVAEGADAGGTFKTYVNYLVDNHYTPPRSGVWVDHVRNKGNEANHEIVMSSKAEAKQLIAFIEMILTFLYEYPARVEGPKVTAAPQ